MHQQLNPKRKTKKIRRKMKNKKKSPSKKQERGLNLMRNWTFVIACAVCVSFMIPHPGKRHAIVAVHSDVVFIPLVQ